MNRLFERVAGHVAAAAGQPWAFIGAFLIIVVGGLSGPVFGWSDTWQLVINTGTTIVTFLMVFLIQNTQNRDGMALQTKLDELILTSDAENAFVGIERLTDRELMVLHAQCAEAAAKHDRLASHAERELTLRKKGKRRHPTAKATKRG